MRFWLAVISAALAASTSTSLDPINEASVGTHDKRQAYDNGSSSLIVDLGYEQYQGVADSSTGFKTWKGYACLSTEKKTSLTSKLRIRYAAPPTGSLRWQAPQPPAVNRGNVLSAATLPQRCPQSPNFPLLVYLVALFVAAVVEPIIGL